MKRIAVACLAVALVFALPSVTWAMATETIGDKSLNALNYREWPGIMPVANHSSRVYHYWCNGHEMFYYQGDTETLNEFLLRFSEMNQPVHEVLLRPGPPADAKTFHGKRIPYGWEMELMGGISKSMTTEEGADKIWSPQPMLTIYVDKESALDSLKVPEGVRVLELADLKKRYIEGLSSSENHVRGWGADRLAALDPFDTESMIRIARLLGDGEWWVRLCAIGALARFGEKALPLIPKIQQCAGSEHKQLDDRVAEVVKKIQSAKLDAAKETRHQRMLKAIEDYVKEAAKR